MSKILLFTLEYPPQVGGVANFYHELVRHDDKHSITTLDNTKNQLLPWWKSIFILHQTVQQKLIDHIMVGQVLPLGTVAAIYSLFKPISFSVFIHGMDITVPQRYWRKHVLLRWILRRAKTIITISAYTGNKIKPLLSPADYTKIHLLPPGPHITPVLLNTTAQPTGMNPGVKLPEQFILSVGRLVERKGFDNTIIALSQLPDKYKNIHYVIAGSGADRGRLLTLAEQHQVADRVHIYEKLSDAQVAQLYQASLFLVAASRVLSNGDFEGFGITVLEANTFGKPAIVGEGGMADAVVSSTTGLVLNQATPEAIVAAMEKLLVDPESTIQLGEQAKRWVEQEHQWPKKTSTLLHFLV